MADKTTAHEGIVLVTGVTGYLAGWIVKQLLEDGWKVRGTVRDAKQQDKYKHLLHQNLQIVEADLLKPDTWPSAVKGCTYVCHTASPFPVEIPKDENLIIKPAVDGTLSVLKAAAAEPCVKRVVLTSSEMAIVHDGKDDSNKVYAEEDWSVPEKCTPYPKSKTLAEKAAWDFMKTVPKDRNIDLVVINPAYIVGPLTSLQGGDSSRKLVERLMKNDMPGIPALWLNFVDVRDVAKAHVSAVSNPKASGRYLCSSGGCWMSDVAQILKKEFEKYGYKIPTMQAPKALLWVVSFWDKDAAGIYPTVGISHKLDPSKASNELLPGSSFRSYAVSLVDMANSMIDFGIIPDLRKTKN